MKNLKTLLCMALLCTFTLQTSFEARAQETTEAKPVTEPKSVKCGSGLYTDTLTYTNEAQSRAAEVERAEREMREPDEERIYARLSIEILRSTLDAARLEYHLLVVRTKDGEIVRRTLEGTLPMYLGHGDAWWNMDNVRLPPETSLPMEVYSIDRIGKGKCAWTINKDGSVLLIPKKER